MAESSAASVCESDQLTTRHAEDPCSFCGAAQLRNVLSRIEKSQRCLVDMLLEIQQDVKGIHLGRMDSTGKHPSQGSFSDDNSPGMPRVARTTSLAFTEGVMSGGARLFSRTDTRESRYRPSVLVNLEKDNPDVPSIVAPALPTSWPTSLKQREGTLTRRALLASSNAAKLSVRSVTSSFAHANLEERTLSRTCLLSPGSAKRLLFDVSSIAILLYDLTLIPFVIAWDLSFEGFVAWSSYTTCSFWTVDLVMNFITGFQHDGELEMRFHHVVRHYLKGACLPDFLILMCDFISIMISLIADQGSSSGEETAQRLRMLRFAKVSRLLRVAGLFRLVRLLRVVEDFVDRSVSEGYRMLLRVMGIFFFVLWLNHVLCCCWYWIGMNAPTDTDIRWTATVGPGGEVYSDRSDVFQYMTSFHWSMAQLTLGAIEVSATNSWERAYSIVLLLCGLLFSATLVSSLSATLIDFQMRMNETHQKVRTLRNFLRQHKVDTTLCHRVMQQAEQRVANKEKLTDEDVPALSMLSASLRAELRFQIFCPYIQRHPLFRLWVNLSHVTARQLCFDDGGRGSAVNFLFLQPLDELFVSGTKSDTAYYFISGELSYIQDPESSPVDSLTKVPVQEGRWLSEPSLWAHWIHVGTAEAFSQCQILCIAAAGVVRTIQKHQVIKEISTEYSSHYHGRLVTAAPPTSHYPTDLLVPFTDFGEIVASMEHHLQVVIARDALDWKQNSSAPFAALDQVDPRKQKQKFPLHVRRQHKGATRDSLEREVLQGEAAIVLNGLGEVQRVVSLFAFQITREDDSDVFFVQLGIVEDSMVVAGCKLPGAKMVRGELPLDAAHRILKSKLEPMADDVEIRRLEREEEWVEATDFPMKKQYLRTVARASMLVEVRAPTVRMQEPLVLDGDVLEELYVFHNSRKVTLHAWVERSDIEYLKGLEGEAKLVKWLAPLESELGSPRSFPLGHNFELRF